MKNKFPVAFSDPSKNLFFFLAFGTFALSLTTDALSALVFENLASWTEEELGILPEIFRVLIFVVSLLIIILVVNWQTVIQWFGAQSVPTRVRPIPLVGTFPGLIAVMSKVPPGVKSPAQVAIEHHWQNGNGNLKHCWLICSGDSVKSARDFVKQFTGLDISEDSKDVEYAHPDNPNRKLKFTLKEMAAIDVDDPNASFQLVNNIYEDAAALEIESEDVIADYTGGTKSMTAGLILACSNPERALQFMRPGGYDAEGRADRTKPSKATQVEIAFKLKSLDN